MTIGKRLKGIRNELGLSQEAFGERIGLSRAGIAAVEADNNKFSQDVLCKLILTYNINLNYLLAGIGNTFIPPKYEDVRSEILAEVEKMLADKGL